MPERTLILSVTLNDCEVQTFRSGGPGGQNQNKRDTGVRVIHRDSGARGESREQRSQLQNKRTAFERMVATDKFQLWIKMKTGAQDVERAELNRRIQNRVDRDMRPENLLVEFYESEPQNA